MRAAPLQRRERRHHLHGPRTGARRPFPASGTRPARLSDLILALIGVTLLGALALVIAAELASRVLTP